MTDAQLQKEIERDRLLYEVESKMLKNKVNAKSAACQRQYGIAANIIHQERVMKLSMIDKSTNTGICTCGRPVDICDEPIYCRYCGQRTSGDFGWTVGDYYNEKGLGIR